MLDWLFTLAIFVLVLFLLREHINNYPKSKN